MTGADEAPAFTIPVSNVLPSEEVAKWPAESTFFHVTVPPAEIVTLFGTKHWSPHLVFVAVPFAISTTASFTGADAAVEVVFLPVATVLSVAFGEALAEGCGVFLVVAFGEALAEGCGVFLPVAFANQALSKTRKPSIAEINEAKKKEAKKRESKKKMKIQASCKKYRLRKTCSETSSSVFKPARGLW